MSRVFFSVDVETSGLVPGRDGELLTIGVEAVSARGNSLGEFYVRINPPDDLRGSSMEWWAEQSPEVRDEAYENNSLVRHNQWMAASMLAEFVTERAEGDDAVFVANPVAFDKAWIDYLFALTCVDNPFHYRSLCLRSMKFGLRPGSEWGSDRENHTPKIPHHALWDAKAQADDLRSMLTERDTVKDISA